MTCFLKLIGKLGMIDFMKKWEPFMSEDELKDIATQALEDIEKEEGHNYERIRKRAVTDDYWQTLVLGKLRSLKKKGKKQTVVESVESEEEYETEEQEQ
jgi:hypothetical protein